MAVDKAHAGLYGGGHTVGFANVFSPHIAAQAVGNVVGQGNRAGFVFEGNQAGDGAEDFVLCDLHAVVHIGKHGGPDEVAVFHAGGQLGGVAGAVQATAQQGGAFFGAELDVAFHLGQMRWRDHGANNGCFIQRIAHGDAFGALSELGHKVGINVLLHQDAAAGGAALAVVAEDHEDGGVQGAVQIGVFKNHERRFAAQLHAEFFQAGGFDDAVARGRGAGE